MSDVNENYGRSRRHRDGGRDDYSDDHHYSDEPAYEGYEGYDDYDDYADDSYAQEGYEDAGYAGAASAYAASDYADADYDEDAAAELDADERPALPLRGLAMVLIAVAVLLAIWGVWAFMHRDSDDSDGAATSSTAPVATAPAPAPAPGAPAPAPAPAQQPAPAPAEQQPAPAPAPAEVPQAQQPAPAPAAGPARINVLNNSTVPDLAANTSRQFTEQGAHVGEVGNLPEEQLKVERTTVFYHPGNADAQHRAEELAARVGGEAQPYNPALPPATAGDNDITLVLAGPVAP
ncbi:LytR C-terminal domain-containing protein [Corynebacterium uberis]|uniref:LytR C-terminal domain-containing protein n=1 Tax=Corynebacterium uberis TaxID=2883169 RepID=UPI001D0BA226|nr:LytR C-terminal domain-containing protein [Corynebacterium uberis]UDL73523.1 LytR C-terminal domain-containing protein [Corynebacterium uberis]